MLSAVSTERLRLRPLAHDDLAATFAIYSDPATWTHLPTARHSAPEQTAWMIGKSTRSWTEHGLGYWSACLRNPLGELAAGTIVGSGGVRLANRAAWNLGYRFDPRSWGRGLASELAAAAIAAARASRPDIPVTARVLSTNPASIRVAERAGMTLVWESDTRTEPHRLVYADRPLDRQTLQSLIALG